MFEEAAQWRLHNSLAMKFLYASLLYVNQSEVVVNDIRNTRNSDSEHVIAFSLAALAALDNVTSLPSSRRHFDAILTLRGKLSCAAPQVRKSIDGALSRLTPINAALFLR